MGGFRCNATVDVANPRIQGWDCGALGEADDEGRAGLWRRICSEKVPVTTEAPMIQARGRAGVGGVAQRW
jgi:hypothetical protein